MYICKYVQIYTHADVYISHIYRYTDIKKYRYTNIQIYRYTDVKIYRYTYIHIYICTDIQTYRYTNIHIYIHIYTSIQI